MSVAGVFARPLLATEHGEFDTGAEALAFALARRRGETLAAILPVTSNPEFEMVAPQLAAKADAEAADRARALEAAAHAAGVELELQVRRGPEPYLEIVGEARERAADLIVIRRRGKRGFLANLLIGEMVTKVVAHAPCDVLIAPRGVAMWSRRVLLGVDPAEPDAGALAVAARVAAAAGVPLRIVCVAAHELQRAQADTAVAEAMRQARASHGEVVGEVRIGRPHQALIDAAREHDADLIVVGRHGREGLARAWIGGTAQRVIGLADGAVLVHVHAPATPATRR